MSYKQLFYFTGQCLALDEHPEFREQIIELFAGTKDSISFLKDGIPGPPQPATWNLEPATWNLEPATWNLEPETWNLELGTRNPKPATRNPQPAIAIWKTLYNFAAIT